MGRHKTGILNTGECLRMELSFIISNGYIKKGHILQSVLSWTNGSEVNITASLDEKYVRLTYNKNNNTEKYDYKIQLTTIPSNLGRGEILYFLCPVTNEKARILYMAYGSPIFKSREAYNHRIYYSYQSCSKFDLITYKLKDTENKIEKLSSQIKKNHYQNKPTKIMKKLEKLHQDYSLLELQYLNQFSFILQKLSKNRD